MHSADTFRDLLREWIAREIIIVNPESFRRTGPTDTIGYETYSARIRAVQGDFIQVGFQAQNRGRIEMVEEYIPMERIKRVSLWGDDLYLHL